MFDHIYIPTYARSTSFVQIREVMRASNVATIAILIFCLTAYAEGSSREIEIPEGTVVSLEFLDLVSSSSATKGQKFNLELVEDLEVDGVTVAEVGTIAVGTVVDVQKRRMLGRSGDLNLSIDYMLIEGKRVRLRATKSGKGNTKIAATAVLTYLFGPLGLLKRGKDVDIDQGTSIEAYVDRPIKVKVSE